MAVPIDAPKVSEIRLKDSQTELPLPRIAKSINKSFVRLLSQRKPVPTLFCELVNKLGKWFSISKATMAIFHEQTGTLKLASWWDMYCFKEGVLMSLPTENSLFYKVLQSSRPLHEQVSNGFPGNYVEKRLMTSKTTAALTVYPLVFNGVVYGVISFSSPLPHAFEMFEDGYFSTVFEKMASVVAERSPGEFWEPLLCLKRKKEVVSDYEDQEDELGAVLQRVQQGESISPCSGENRI